ncbi:MAG: hypothetical protein COB17_09930 [Sulfurimonas sp.]|nr:MAG: hypothetical protein COB17_09930 [Sulfurimonas sp.]
MNKVTATVLYVENDCDIRKGISAYLSYKFTNIIEAKDAEIAYQLYQAKKPDLIITDINLGKFKGIELIQKIRNIDKNIPIIITSSYFKKDKLLKIVNLNIIDYIIKPIEKATLQFALDVAVSQILSMTDNSQTIVELEFNKLKQISRIKKEHACAVFININNLSLINDAFSFNSKSELIKIFFEALVLSVKKNDLVVPLMGDTFLILLLDSSLYKIEQLTNKIKNKIKNIEINGYRNFTCTCSMEFINHDDSLYEVINRLKEKNN